MTRSLNDDCYRWTNHGHVTTHAHFEGGLCVVPEADPLFLRRVEAYEEGGWEAWAVEKRRQRRGLPTVTPQRLPISPPNAKHGYSEAMTNPTDQPDEKPGAIETLSRLIEGARQFAESLDIVPFPDPGPGETDDGDTPTGITVTDDEGLDTNIPRAVDYYVGPAGDLNITVPGADNRERRIATYAPHAWNLVRQHPKAEQ